MRPTEAQAEAMARHEHTLEKSPFVIDTYPPMHTWVCRGCGLKTHDPETLAVAECCWRPFPESEP